MGHDTTMTVDRDDFENLTRAAIAKLLRIDVERLEIDASLTDDLKVDSLDFIALIVGLEREFDVSFPDVEAARIKTVSELLDSLHSLMASAVVADALTAW